MTSSGRDYFYLDTDRIRSLSEGLRPGSLYRVHEFGVRHVRSSTKSIDVSTPVLGGGYEIGRDVERSRSAKFDYSPEAALVEIEADLYARGLVVELDFALADREYARRNTRVDLIKGSIEQMRAMVEEAEENDPAMRSSLPYAPIRNRIYDLLVDHGPRAADLFQAVQRPLGGTKRSGTWISLTASFAVLEVSASRVDLCAHSESYSGSVYASCLPEMLSRTMRVALREGMSIRAACLGSELDWSDERHELTLLPLYLYPRG